MNGSNIEYTIPTVVLAGIFIFVANAELHPPLHTMRKYQTSVTNVSLVIQNVGNCFHCGRDFIPCVCRG